MRHSIWRPLAAVLLVLAMVCSLAACGGKKGDESSGESSEPKANIVETEPEFDTISDFLDDPTVSKQISSVLAENDDISVTVKAEGNKLVYEYTFAEDVEVTDEVKASLEENTQTQHVTFENIADALQGAIREANPSVVIRYLDAEGNNVYEKEFKSVE